MEKFIDRHYFKPQKDTLIEHLRESVSDQTIEAMATIPRHMFVSPPLLHHSYVDRALPILEFPYLPISLKKSKITEFATISQPSIVGKMTDMLSLSKSDRVLEIGTATGYQAAILSKLAKEVVTVEIFKKLAVSAKKRLDKLGINNVNIIVADASNPFFKKHAFDKIIVTASVPPIPPHHPLLSMLKPDGIAVIPLGGDQGQENFCELLAIRACENGYEIVNRESNCVFVSLQGRHGWEDFMRSLTYTYYDRMLRKMDPSNKPE